MNRNLQAEFYIKYRMDEIEFSPYSNDEIFQIIKERLGHGLAEHSITDDLFALSESATGTQEEDCK